jgi:predicted HicB family RNase H-like nuclease
MLRIDAQLYERVKELAHKQNCSVNHYLCEAVRYCVECNEDEDREPEI